MSTVAQQWTTLAILVGVALFLIGSDVWLIHARGVQASYSRVLAQVFASHPVVLAVFSFALGCFVGHCLLNTHPR